MVVISVILEASLISQQETHDGLFDDAWLKCSQHHSRSRVSSELLLHIICLRSSTFFMESLFQLHSDTEGLDVHKSQCQKTQPELHHTGFDLSISPDDMWSSPVADGSQKVVSLPSAASKRERICLHSS